ncbi:MAG: ATP phosphoribosyltransferase regulatory subunit [Oscillospiraceae bacterium]|jgi:ATP phosphoribosyltransferase regulatory subunit|nr:ATP phosphoribosyltransferase regulatory subunit [Oscillospiraceae bacterium]
MKKHNLITPEGTRDLLFEECKARRDIETKLMDLFKGEGYSEVITPSLEFYDVFNSFPQESMYKLTDAKGRLMVIRPDSTIPIIRLAETRLKDEPRPLKLCYNQTIYNVNPKDAGRDDETAQCGVEYINDENSMSGSDIKVLKLAAEAIKATNFDFRFEIGNGFFFEVLIKENRIEANDAEKIRQLVEEKNYPALSVMNIPDIFIELPKLFGGGEVFDKADKLFKSDNLKKCLNMFKKVYNELREKVAGENITIDLGFTSKRDYYEGILFNGYAAGCGKPILEGGNYKINNTSGIGFAVNVSAVARLSRGNYAK